MRKNSTFFLLAFCMLALNFSAKSQISGTVFRDYNGNGVRGTVVPNNEPFVSGINVNAYNDAAILIASYTTSNLGAYTIPAAGTYNGIIGSNTGSVPNGTKVRLEFIIPTTGCDLNPTIDYSSVKGTGNATSVQFVTGGVATTNVNFAINGSGDYTTTTNPNIVMSASVNGNPLAANGTATTDDAFVGFPYNNSGTTAPNKTMTGVRIGSCWGVAYSKQAGKIFTAAFIKRHAGLGTLGSGGIYILTPETTSFTAADFYDMDANTYRTRAGAGAPAYGLGTSYSLTGDENITFLGATDAVSGLPVGHGVVGTNVERGLPNNNTGTSYDAAAFEQTGKMGLADLEISDDGKFLFVTNLYDKKIYRLELNSATNPTSIITVTSYVLPVVTATNGVLRPFGIEFKRGNLYVGAVTTGENGGTAANLSAYVFTLNNATGAASFAATPALNFPLNYVKGPSMTWTNPDYGANWRPWSKVTGDPEGGGTDRTFPTPILSDIEFDERGTMIVAFLDRSGNQYSENNLRHLRNVATLIKYTVGGDVIAAKSNCNGTFTTENNGSYTASNGITYTSGAANNQGIGNSEFFKGDLLATFHEETTTGALAYLLGSDEVYASLMDPFTNTNTGGVARLSMINGVKTTGYQITGANVAGWGKANSLGDLEIIGDLSPIEIGNRVWNDANGNGIQDPSELPIANVNLGIFVDNNNDGIPDGAAIGTTTTSATGEWYFNNADITGDADPNTAGTQATLTSGVRYIVRPATADWAGGVGVGDLAGFQLTKTDQVSNGAVDLSDNDASLIGTTPIPQISVLIGAAGENNHNLDFGFKGLATLSNKVWLDQGAGANAQNGTQDSDEPGVASVPVNLYRNGADGLPGTNDDVLVASTLTDAFGMYLFENLTPTDQTNATTIGQTSYNVRVTPPANYSITTQTNTTDDNNTTGASTTGSDVNALGVSYAVNLSSGENNPNIDAGLIFKPAALTNSIGDKVWYDADGNGINANSATEPGVAGVSVTLYDASGNIVAVTKTDANGNYLFDGLPASTTYSVGFSAPGGTKFTTGGTLDITDLSTNSDPNPATGRTVSFSSGAAGTKITGVDAGLVNDTNGALGDKVWLDLNNNNVQDPTDPGVPGVTMKLYNAGADGVPGGGDDLLIGTTTTDANGNYLFPNLNPAKYFVVATPASGHTNVTKDVGANDTKDSDFGTGAGIYVGLYVSNVYTLLPIIGGVTRDMTVDVGIRNTNAAQINSLGNRVWNDVNKDGIQGSTITESGVPNVTVRLLNGTGTAANNPATGAPYVVSTDTLGNYLFVNLPDGNYIVEFANIPSGYSFTGQDAAGSGNAGSTTDTDTDSDANTVTGRTSVIDLDNGNVSGATPVNIVKVDAGISQGVSAGTASIGNRVWYDKNGNGTQDAGELGVNNVRVELLDASDNPVNVPGGVVPYVVRTNGLGEYLFTGLPAGQYKVRFSQIPSGFTSSTANTANQGQAGDDIDADASFAGTSVLATTIATSPIYTLQVGEDNPTVDIGLVPLPATGGALNAANNRLGDYVWLDANNNGTQGSITMEPGVPGVTVTLYTNGADGIAGTADDVQVGTTTTDGKGAYEFVGLADGNYNVGFTNLPAGFSLTNKEATPLTDGSDANQASGRTTTYALDPTSATATAVNNPDIDGGIVGTRAALGNQVWLDTDGDGVLNNGEKGVQGVLVTLYEADGTTVVSSTITDADGKYFFANLNAGTYVVGFSNVPSNLEFTKQTTAGTTDNLVDNNSDANPITGKTAIVVLTAGETDLTVDAGLRPSQVASVGNFVWFDKDGNGVQNAGEPGVPGIFVTIYDAGTNLPVGMAVTDGDGKYLVDKLPAAATGTSYYAIFTNLPATATFTTRTDNVGASDATFGSDPAPGTGRTSDFTLTPGLYLPHVDAGIQNIQLLPIKIISFTAVPKGSQVNLEWIVSEQTGVDTYEVEASADSRTFTTIATIASNSNQGATYDAVHTTPVAGINYYRIKTIEKDGTISYSQIRKVNFGKGGDVVIYPNPVSTGVVNITLTGNMINKAATVSIISMEGKQISQQQLVKTSQTETLDVSTLANGSYIVRLVTNDTILNTKLQIAK